MSFTHTLLCDVLTPPHQSQPPGEYLQEFIDEICEVTRGLQFARRKVGTFATGREDERWVYMPGEPYPMGWVGYGDYQYAGPGEDMFIVCSRKIFNGKYTHGDQHHMRMSRATGPAVRNAKRYLQNYRPSEMAEVRVGDLRSEIRDVGDKLDKQLTVDARAAGVFGDLTSDPGEGTATLMTELRHLANTGHEFVNAAYGVKLRAMLTSLEEQSMGKGQQLNMSFVSVRQRLGVQSFDVVDVDGAQDWNIKVAQESTRYTDNLPEDILGKMSVLSMLENGKYVGGVGYRISDSMFYVTR